MHYFLNDYSDGGHPDVLRALQKDSEVAELGYGKDSASREAESLILSLCRAPKGKVFFASGGTQANLVVAAALLKPFESIVAADTGHILHHEAGAIEATGHKVHGIAHHEGKVLPDALLQLLAQPQDEHLSRPRLLYLSQSTELGTVYSRSELEVLSEIAHSHNLLVYVDGARLGSATASKNSPPDLSELARLLDIFTIGGTKNGALFGEAIVIPNIALHADFPWHLKQRGALLARGRAIGVQFRELFREGLFFQLAESANQKAEELAAIFRKYDIPFAYQLASNQIFPVVPHTLIKHLKEQFHFYEWQKVSPSHSSIRLICSWWTPQESLSAMERALEDFSRKSQQS